MTVKITGVVEKIHDKETIKENLEKQRVEIKCTEENNGKFYDNYYSVEFINRNISLVKELVEGVDTTLIANLKGKKTATGKIFTTLECFKIE